MNTFELLVLGEIERDDYSKQIRDRLMANPGHIVYEEDIPKKHKKARAIISEGGGSLWCCEACKEINSPNRPCCCENMPTVLKGRLRDFK